MVERNRQYDIAKGIAMILVLLGHCHHRQIEIFVCLFHMPVFLFVSGFFWKDDYLEHAISFAKKRFKSLYFPYLGYEIVFFFLRPLFLSIGWYDSSISWNIGVWGVLKEVVNIILLMGREQLLGAFWYLVMLIILECGYWIISFIVKKLFNSKEEARFALVFLTWLGGCTLSKYVIIPRIGSALIAIPFFYIGFLMCKYSIKLKYNIITLGAAFAFLIASVSYGSAAIGSVTIHDPAFQLMCGCVGIYLVLGISQHIARSSRKWTKVFDLFGQNTITVMAFHEIGFKLLSTLLCITPLASQINLSAIPVGNNGFVFVIPYFITSVAFTLVVVLLKISMKKCLNKRFAQ